MLRPHFPRDCAPGTGRKQQATEKRLFGIEEAQRSIEGMGQAISPPVICGDAWRDQSDKELGTGPTTTECDIGPAGCGCSLSGTPRFWINIAPFSGSVIWRSPVAPNGPWLDAPRHHRVRRS